MPAAVMCGVLLCSCPWAVAAEREAGYIMLGSMCAAAPPSLLEGRSKQQQVLELFSVALGPTAAEALTDTAAAAAGAHSLILGSHLGIKGCIYAAGPCMHLVATCSATHRNVALWVVGGIDSVICQEPAAALAAAAIR